MHPATRFPKGLFPEMSGSPCRSPDDVSRHVPGDAPARRRNALVGVSSSLMVCLVAILLLAGCGEAVDPGPEPRRPPGFDQLEPAVQEQFVELLDRLARARADAAPAPEMGRAWGELGKWFDVYRFPDSAMHCYRQAARLDANEPRWSYYLGLLAVNDGDLDLAVAAFETAERLAPESIAAPMQLAELKLKRGQATEAGEHYRRVLDTEPGNLAASLGLARLHLQNHEADLALELLKPHLGDEARVPAELRYLAAQAHRLRGDAELARRQLDLLPEDHGDRTPLGVQDPWRNELMAIKVNSNHLTRLGIRASRQGNFRLAARYSGRAAALNPDNAELRTNYAASLLALGRAGDALEQVDKALAQDPNLARAYLVKGGVRLRLGDRLGAREAFLGALALDGGLKDARRHLGRIYQQMGETELAIDQYAELRKRYREAHQARFWHAALLASLGRFDQAMAALDADLEVHPQSPLLRLLRVRILATASGKSSSGPVEAAALFAGLAPYEHDVYSIESAAMVAAALGYHADAVELQRRAIAVLETLPEGEPARIARRRLVLYSEQKACHTPWQRGELLITKPVDAPIGTQEWMESPH
ncbi:MAG: hypothetical protein CMP07_00095 [Xanthomonadales bacterium]|nr:hypothetical protein [Xanthomonadales bacterium]